MTNHETQQKKIKFNIEEVCKTGKNKNQENEKKIFKEN